MHFGFFVSIFLLKFTSDSFATRLWVKHGCIKAGGVSICGRTGPHDGIGKNNWFRLTKEAIFEVGFPPYLTPEDTYPICVQKLNWPLIWEDIHFDLEKKCISSEQGEIPDDTYIVCCTKTYSKSQKLKSPYFIKNIGEKNPDGRVRDPDHESMKSEWKSFKSLDEHGYQSDSSSTESAPLEYLMSNRLDDDETSFLPVAPTGAVEEISDTAFRASEDDHERNFLAINDHHVDSQPVTDEPGSTEGLEETFIRRQRIR